MGKNSFVYDSLLTDEFQHDHVFLHPDLLDNRIDSFAALIAHSMLQQISVLSEANKDKDMVVYYDDDNSLLIVQIDDKTAISMKINPRAFGIKKANKKRSSN